MLASPPETPVTNGERFYARVFGLTAAAVIGYLLVRIVEPFLAPALWAALLAFTLFPLNRRIRARMRGRKGWAAALVTLLVLLGLVLPAVGVGFAFFDQAVDLGRRLQDTAAQYQIDGVEDLLRLPVIGRAVLWAQERFGLDPAKAQSWLLNALRNIVDWILAHGRSAVVGAFGFVAGLILMLFLLFFFFRDGDETMERALVLVPLDPGRKERLIQHISGVTRAVVNGTIVTAIVQGTLVGIGFWIAGLPSPVVFGALTAIASFVPLVGTGLVVVPAVLYLVMLGSWGKAIFLLVWGIVVVGAADNVLRPLLISGRSEIGALAAFVGAVGGLAAFGLVGLFGGPVIVALGLALIRFAEEGRAVEGCPAPPGPADANV